MKDINLIAKKLGVPKDKYITNGDDMAKINYKFKGNKKGKLVLVTAINPTKYGEGKTTMAIGISDALNKAGKDSLVVLREPSLGPVFGIKGGATGAGQSKITPTDKINLHFTGDMHAITSANNLISAVIDNHIFQGNELEIKEVTWKRAMDMNDRALRGKFIITAASEIMAILCLAKSMRDLKERLNRIIFGTDKKGKPLFVEQLGITGSLVVLLKDAINPNLVQTKKEYPVLVHGGPFANIAHGTSSLIALNQAMSLSDFTIVEAGFGADLGAEKFINIFSRVAKVSPSVVVLVATIRALKHNGNGDLIKGFDHLKRHIDNLTEMNTNTVVALNKFEDDSTEEISLFKNWCSENNVDFEIANVYNGSAGSSKKLANLIIDKSRYHKVPKYSYIPNEKIKSKIDSIAKKVYGAKKVVYSDEAIKKLKWLEKNHLDRQYICMAKTPSSLSDNPKLLGSPKGFELNVRDISISNGAGFIIVECGKIMRMPGLGKNPNAMNIDLIGNKVEGVE